MRFLSIAALICDLNRSLSKRLLCTATYCARSSGDCAASTPALRVASAPLTSPASSCLAMLVVMVSTRCSVEAWSSTRIWSSAGVVAVAFASGVFALALAASVSCCAV
ncbi:hypothetical protein D3C81_1171850 [compost metagenome]